MSTISPTLSSPIHPFFQPNPSNNPESSATASLVTHLALQPHAEGGYFVETDRDPLCISNPFLPKSPYTNDLRSSSHDISAVSPHTEIKQDDSTRSASTTIFYLLTPHSPMGVFHMNKARTMHTLHKGRGRYVIIHPPTDEANPGNRKEKATVETFVVGDDIEKGESMQWMVEGGKWKASFLLPDREDDGSSKSGLLISETVVPGFEFRDHDFLRKENLEELVTKEQAEEMGWLVRKSLDN